MRSRYTAYAVGDTDYVLATWHLSTRPESIHDDPNVKWHGLTVVGSTGGAFDVAGTVEFRARFERSGAPLELHELSSFVQERGRWLYVEGSDPDQM